MRTDPKALKRQKKPHLTTRYYGHLPPGELLWRLYDKSRCISTCNTGAHGRTRWHL